jgi:hypothetical protein
MTTTRSVVSAITPRSWVISTIAAPVLLLQLDHQVEDLRLDGDVERRGRLVGDQHLGIAGQRHGDHDALAHAARKLVRILVERGGGVGDAHQSQHLDRAFPAAFARHAGALDVLGDLRRPTVSTGFRLVIGSWKIIEMSLPRRRACRIGERRQLLGPRT